MGFPSETDSAVTKRAGSTNPAASSLMRARLSVALVTTVHRFLGNASISFLDSGKNSNALAVGKLDVLDDLQFLCAVEVGPHHCDALDCPAAVNHAQRIRWIHSAQIRPLRPAPLHRAERRNKNPVHVKENAFATEDHGGRGNRGGGHVFYCIERAILGRMETRYREF